MKFINLLREHHAEFVQAYQTQLTPSMHQAMNAMLVCKTQHSGCSQWHCDDCQQQSDNPLSCGHRSCNACQHNATQDWLNRQQLKLLPVDYYMVTFTLPYELRAMTKRHESEMYPIMFQVAASVLKDFGHREAKTNKGTQANVGFTAVLHSHSRKRDYHPHLHVIVPAGSYDSHKNQWQKSKGNYLFNAFNLATVWRARMLEQIKQHPALTLPKALPKKWVVDCAKVGRGLPALKYLSRYLYRGVLADKNIINANNNAVTFRYEDSETKTIQRRTLPTLEFLWLIIQHVLPKGLRRVRDYGLLSGGNRKRLRQIQRLLALLTNAQLPEVITTERKKAVMLCPCCRHPMEFIGIKRAKTG